MSQTDPTTYGFDLEVAQAGQKYDLSYDQVDSFAAEGAVPFGVAVVAGTDPNQQVALVETASDVFRGIALFTHTREQGFNRAATPASTGAQYLDTETVSVLSRGRVWVKASGNVTAGALAYADLATTFNDSFTVTSTDNLKVGRFHTSGSDGELVVLEVDKAA
ncbi:hypothetical protein ACFOGJ_08870 [Marinibaculum pumilum]|uniref:DUF2190 family protein n=1 Tax=Marinibaculum pumilum TaxID=1766165 RepID=A0ABV7KYY7_9PROT